MITRVPSNTIDTAYSDAPAVQITLVVPAVHEPPEYVYLAKFTDSDPSHHTMYRCGVDDWMAFSSLAV